MSRRGLITPPGQSREGTAIAVAIQIRAPTVKPGTGPIELGGILG